MSGMPPWQLEACSEAALLDGISLTASSCS